MIVAPLASAVVAALAISWVLSRIGRGRPFDHSGLDRSRPHRRWRHRRRWVRRRARIVPSEVASWCDDLARSLRHGATLRAALVTVTPSDAVLEARTAHLRRRLERGASVRDGCDEWSAQLASTAGSGREVLTTLAAVLAASATLGGSAAAPIDRFAAAMRQRAADELERTSQSAQARMSARVMTIVPLGVLALLLLNDEDVRRIVVRPLGAAVVSIGLALNGLGSWWMQRIVAGPGASRMSA